MGGGAYSLVPKSTHLIHLGSLGWPSWAYEISYLNLGDCYGHSIVGPSRNLSLIEEFLVQEGSYEPYD